MKKEFKILSLDGGGSKGVYTLGILNELEKLLGGKLCDHFDLIYGTSTGSIIASLLALGENVKSIEGKYFDLIPKIMCGRNKETRSEFLKSEADKIFEKKNFDEFKTLVGIVSMNYDEQKPFVFKTHISQAHGMKPTFKPGFGCTISTAVQASCAAYPIFDFRIVETENQGPIKAVDGGFVANNPTLFALIDAHKAIGNEETDLKVLSIGVGRFIEKPLNWKFRVLKKFKMAQFIERVFSTSTITNETLTKLLYPNLNYVRVNDTFNEPEYGTNMVEVDKSKLTKLMQLGRNSYAKNENDIRKLFNK